MDMQTFTHEELNEYLEDCAYHAEAISYPQVAEQLREGKTSMTLEEKIDYIQNEQEYELFDPCGCKVTI